MKDHSCALVDSYLVTKEFIGSYAALSLAFVCVVVERCDVLDKQMKWRESRKEKKEEERETCQYLFTLTLHFLPIARFKRECVRSASSQIEQCLSPLLFALMRMYLTRLMENYNFQTVKLILPQLLLQLR